MSCEWQTRLDPYVDAELTGTELAQMEEHLRTCPNCSAEALGRMQMKRSVHLAGKAYAPSPEFRLTIRKTIEEQKPKRFWMLGRLPAFSAVAAVAALVVVASGLWLQGSHREQALGELADLHVSTLASASPVDVVSTDRHTVKPWFQGKLPFTFNLPELQGSPFRLIGGRMTYFEQSPGAHMLFEVRKHQISVFIFQDRAELSRLNLGSSSVSRTMAFTIETWTEGGLRYFVVGDAGAEDIHALSNLLKAAAKS